MNRVLLYLLPNITWTGGIVVVMVAGIARTTMKMLQNQNAANYYLYYLMAKKIIKSLAKKLLKKVTEEKPRSTVKEYSFFADVYDKNSLLV